MELVNALSICSKFRVSLGEYIDGLPIYFTNGVFLFDDPSVCGGLSQRDISISGTDSHHVLFLDSYNNIREIEKELKDADAKINHTTLKIIGGHL